MLDGKKIVIKTGESFTTVPADLYTCQICDVEAVEQANMFKGGEIETRLQYKFVILDADKNDESGSPLRGRYLWKRTSLSLNEKSWLYKLAKAVYGHELSMDEKKKFNAEAIIGMQVNCMVEQVTSKDGGTMFANITSFIQTKKELPKFDYVPSEKKEVERSSSAIKEATKSDVDEFISGLNDKKSI